MMLGKLIVIEGTDGSGKATQTKLLVDRLAAEGRKVITFSFPQYGKKSAGPVEEYLNKKYGDPDSVSPYAASLFYAVDRFDIASEIRKARKAGAVVVLDRYVDSNGGHQGGKIRDAEERRRYLAWLYELEYGVLGIPKPDVVVILHVPAELGQKLVARKSQRQYIEQGIKDGHEDKLEHLQNAEAAYLWLAKEHPQNHRVVECVQGGELLAPEAVHEEVYKIAKQLLK